MSLLDRGIEILPVALAAQADQTRERAQAPYDYLSKIPYPRVKTTSIVVSTSTGSPLSVVGL